MGSRFGVCRNTADANLDSVQDYHPLNLAWSPDGQRIAFDSPRFRQQGAINSPDHWSIYMMNADDTNVYYVTEGTNPAWRPAR